MTRYFQSLLALIIILPLSGCVDRAQADAKLANACQAAVDAVLPEGEKLTTITQTNFEPSPSGLNHRHVRLVAISEDDWLQEEKNYDCIFEENFGFFNMNFTASLYQIRWDDDQIIGQAGGRIMGEAEQMIKVTDAIREVLYK